MYSIEELWEKILSKDSEMVAEAYNSLSTEEQQQVFRHLKAMSTESGWQSEQKRSADAALEAICKIME